MAHAGSALHCELSLISSGDSIEHDRHCIKHFVQSQRSKLQGHKLEYLWMTTCLCALQALREWLRQSTNTEDAFANEREAAKKGMCTEAWQIVCRSGISMWSQTHVLPPQTGKSPRNSWLHSNGLKLAWWEALKGISFVVVQISSSQQCSENNSPFEPCFVTA